MSFNALSAYGIWASMLLAVWSEMDSDPSNVRILSDSDLDSDPQHCRKVLVKVFIVINMLISNSSSNRSFRTRIEEGLSIFRLNSWSKYLKQDLLLDPLLSPFISHRTIPLNGKFYIRVFFMNCKEVSVSEMSKKLNTDLPSVKCWDKKAHKLKSIL